MSEVLTHKEPLGHSLNGEDIHADDFFLPNQNEVLSGKGRAGDTSEQAHQFADEMEKLGIRTKVFEGEDSPFPDILHSLTLVDHDKLPNGPLLTKELHGVDKEQVQYNHPEIFQDLDITPIEDSDSVTYEIPGVGVLSLLRLDDYDGKHVLQVDIAEIDEDKQGLGLGADMYKYVANHLPESYQGILSGTITHEAIHHIYETLGKEPGFLLHKIGHGIKPSMYLLETVKHNS